MAKEKKKKPELYLIDELCKKCGICKIICPKDVIDLDKFTKPSFARMENCNSCGLCILHCPDWAIVAKKEIIEEFLKREVAD